MSSDEIAFSCRFFLPEFEVYRFFCWVDCTTRHDRTKEGGEGGELYREVRLMRWNFPLTVSENESDPTPASVTMNVTLPDSLTTWYLETISTNPRMGFCAADPIKIRVEEDYSVQLDMPSRVFRNETVQLEVTLHNYVDEEITGQPPEHDYGRGGCGEGGGSMT